LYFKNKGIIILQAVLKSLMTSPQTRTSLQHEDCVSTKTRT